MPRIPLMNHYLLPQPVSFLQFHSCMCNEQSIFLDDFSEFGQIEKSLNGQNCFEDITSNSRKPSW